MRVTHVLEPMVPSRALPGDMGEEADRTPVMEEAAYRTWSTLHRQTVREEIRQCVNLKK